MMQKNPIFIALALLFNTSAVLAECQSVLHLPKISPVGAMVTDNSCKAATELGLGSVIKLAAGARIWLESIGSTPTSKQFQIVCLNKLSTTQTLKITSMNLPWLTAVSSLNCSEWIANRMACKPKEYDGSALLCAIAPKLSTATAQSIQPKTSVTMRGIGAHVQLSATEQDKQWAAQLKPGIDLCRQVSDNQQKITLSWTISTSGQMANPAVIEPEVEQAFASCALDVLDQMQFAPVNAEMQVSLSF